MQFRAPDVRIRSFGSSACLRAALFAAAERIARREQQRLKDDARRRPTSSQGNDILSNASYATASASATPQTHNGLATTEHTTGVKRAFAEEPET